MKRLFVVVAAVAFGLAGAGLAVAARNSTGTYTLPAGNPVVAGTTITSTWANNTLSDIQTELTDSASRSGKGGFLAPLKIVDGTVAAPAYSFTSEPGSGIYRVGASTPALSVSGVKRQEWTTTGTVVTGTLESTGNATVGGTLGVTGAATLASAGVTGNATVGGTLGVTGAGSFGGALDMNSHLISEVTDPVGAQDAATKAYVDTAIDAAAEDWTITWVASWAADAGYENRVSKSGGIVTLVVGAHSIAPGDTQPMTLPSGHRPSGYVRVPALNVTDSTSVMLSVASTGAVTVSPHTPGKVYVGSVSFRAAP